MSLLGRLIRASTPICQASSSGKSAVMLAGLSMRGRGGARPVVAVRGLIWPRGRMARFRQMITSGSAGASSRRRGRPVLLMLALAASSASSVSLLLNLESVFTPCWLGSCFERISTDAWCWDVSDRSRRGDSRWRRERSEPLARAAVAGACLCWALDTTSRARFPRGTPSRSRHQRSAAERQPLRGGRPRVGAAGTGDRRRRRPGRLLGYGVSLALFVRRCGTRRRANRRLFFDARSSVPRRLSRCSARRGRVVWVASV